MITSGLVFHYQNIRLRNQKSEIINSNISIKNDSTKTSEIQLNALISKSLDAGFELFLFENKELRYSSGFDSPDYSYCQKQLKN